MTEQNKKEGAEAAKRGGNVNAEENKEARRPRRSRSHQNKNQEPAEKKAGEAKAKDAKGKETKEPETRKESGKGRAHSPRHGQ